ncbi:MAG: hypothetical protein WCE80_07305 [Acidimicrobiia bacterium]
MSTDADRLLEMSRRLAEIDAALDGDYREPSSEHLALLEERDALRAEAAHYRVDRDAARSNEQLRAELHELRKERKSLIGTRTGYATSMGGGSSSPSPGEWVTLAAQSRKELGRLDGRIGEIESELERREKPDQRG